MWQMFPYIQLDLDADFLFLLVLLHYSLKLKRYIWVLYLSTTDWFWTTYSSPALCGSSCSFLFSWCWFHVWDWVYVLGFGVVLKISLYIQMSERSAGVGTWRGLRDQIRVICTIFLWHNHLIKTLDHLSWARWCSSQQLFALEKNVCVKQLYSYCAVCKVLTLLKWSTSLPFNAWWNRGIYFLFLESEFWREGYKLCS